MVDLPMSDNRSEDEVYVDNENVKVIDDGKRIRRKKDQLHVGATAARKCGICYLSRIPPHMDPSNLRHILSQYGEIQRIYLVPEDPTGQLHGKQPRSFRGKKFSEGWVEFAKRSVAKRVANMLNGEIIGGKRRSTFYYDTWNIKYLSKFKWDDLISEIACRNRSRDEKLALEISAAKRERDFYLSKVEQSRALTHIQERLKKKQKTNGSDVSTTKTQEPKISRQFAQKKPIDVNATHSKSRLPKEFLAEVFSSGS